jgi:hypothetical protein
MNGALFFRILGSSKGLFFNIYKDKLKFHISIK